MKKFTIILAVLIASAFALQVNAGPAKGPMRSNAYSSLPSGYQQLGNTSIYYNISQRYAPGPGNQYGVSLLGKIGDQYYSSTFEHEDEPSLWNWWSPTPQPGAGFIAALQVDDNTPVYVNALNGTTNNDVRMTTRLEPQGEVAARIVYTLTNNNQEAVTINAGVWADIMIGTNDEAPLERLATSTDATYGIKMKASNNPNSPLLCALFGEGVTGVTPVDDYWFGFYSSNWHANEIVGNYSNTIYNVINAEGGTVTNSSTNSQYYMVENGTYDSGLGFCWKERTIKPGESIELSYVISVGEIDFEEPEQPGEDHFSYNIEVYNIEAWNDLEVAHPAHVWGYYEHAYGQEGFIEYRVDGANREWTGEWTRIETPLISGQTYDLPFDLFFNPEETELHTLEMRFNDGLDNTVPMDGLEWEDVRSISLTVAPEVQAYDGTPKTFVVTVGGVVDYTVGEGGEYVTPGTYSQSIWGDYEMNTIGINTVNFTIDKGQAVVEVESPGDVEYDGNPHGAIVTLITGDTEPIVTYYQIDDDGVLHEISGVPVEQGIYCVEVVVPESDFYYGTDGEAGPYQIFIATSVEELMINGEDNGAWYTIDGRRVAAPTQRGVYIHNGKKYIVM